MNNDDDNKNNSIYEFSKDEMLLKTKLTESLSKKLIGPLYLIGGIYGIYKGIIKVNKIIPSKNFSKKIIISFYLNYICEQSLKYSNTLGTLGVLYCLLNKSYNLVEKKLKKRKIDFNIENNYIKNSLIGFSTGSLYKCTKGFKPSILNGFIIGNCSLLLTYITNNSEKLNKKQLNFFKNIKLYKH
jgi:hypothetical protein